MSSSSSNSTSSARVVTNSMSSEDPSPRIKRTPDTRFQKLKDYNFQSHYIDVLSNGIDNDRVPTLRMHYIDEYQGKEKTPKETVLLLHGEPSWSYLYRYFIPPLAKKGYRVVAPDLIGFGKSDKPSEKSDYTYDRHKLWIREFVEKLDLHHITLFCQDWGALIGLALVGTPDMNHRFIRICVSNGFLPTGEHKASDGFLRWQRYASKQKSMNCGEIVQGAVCRELLKEEVDGYNAPFPDATYQAGALQFPLLVPTPSNPYPPNKEAWKILQRYQHPVLTIFGEDDAVTRGAEKVIQKLIPGCQNVKGVKHQVLQHAGHFIQEDAHEVLVKNLITLIEKNPINNEEEGKGTSQKPSKL